MAVALPIIPINVLNPTTHLSFDTDALIDCGASKNLFPSSVAKVLGINDIADTETGKGQEFGGIAGQRVLGYPHRLHLEIGGAYRFETVIFFLKEDQQQMPLLGIQGFLDHFIIKLAAHRGSIELTPLPSKKLKH
ncbi:MAG: retroviral-like aspartic protease [Elusimicrobia bacterium]|nr:retroviral-like aspartic protease [Elusimicrobiota bacterium]